MGEEDDFVPEHPVPDPDYGGERTTASFGEAVYNNVDAGMPHHHALIAAINELGPVPIVPGPSPNY